MKKGLVIFAATSMMAAGVSLASNISFGQRMAEMLANTFDFMGPVSGFMHNLVKPVVTAKTPVIPNFQDELKNSQAKHLKSQNAPAPALALTGPQNADQFTTGQNVEGLVPTKKTGSNLADQSLGNLAYSQGSVAQGIMESGQSSYLAALGRSLQAKSIDFGNGSQKDVWANLMNKADLKPIELALNVAANHKEMEAGVREASPDLQNQAVVAGSPSGTAGQIAQMDLARAGSAASAPSSVPLPSSLLLLILAWAVSLGLTFRKRPARSLQ